VSGSPTPVEAPIVVKPGLLDRLFGWCVEKVAKLIWRVFMKPVLVAAFSPLLMVLGLADVKWSDRSRRRPLNDEATNPADAVEGHKASGDAERDLEGRIDHG
jgi:hypothetical protein